jgi:hypothetical protein
MRALVLGETVRVSRHPAVIAALCVAVGVLAAFIGLWPRGVPLSADSTVYAQALTVGYAVTAVLMPWIVYRTLVPETANDVVLRAAMSGVAPSRLLTTTACVALLLAAVLATAMLPVLLLAQQMTGASSADLFAGVATLYLAAGAAALVPLGCRRVIHGRVSGWLVATAGAIALLTVAGPTVVGVLAIVVAAAGSLLAWVTDADRRFQYLEEQPA